MAINDTLQTRLQAPQTAQTPVNMNAFQEIAATNETDPMQTVQEVNELARTTEAAFKVLIGQVIEITDRLTALEQRGV